MAHKPHNEEQADGTEHVHRQLVQVGATCPIAKIFRPSKEGKIDQVRDT